MLCWLSAAFLWCIGSSGRSSSSSNDKNWNARENAAASEAAADNAVRLRLAFAPAVLVLFSVSLYFSPQIRTLQYFVRTANALDQSRQQTALAPPKGLNLNNAKLLVFSLEIFCPGMLVSSNRCAASCSHAPGKGHSTRRCRVAALVSAQSEAKRY